MFDLLIAQQWQEGTGMQLPLHAISAVVSCSLPDMDSTLFLTWPILATLAAMAHDFC